MPAYLIMLVGWVATWVRPRADVFNLFGLILALWLALGVAISSSVVPQSFGAASLSWVVHMAVYLLVGAGIMAWKKREGVSAATPNILPNTRLAPAARGVTRQVFRGVVPLAILLAVAAGGISFLQGRGVASLWVGLLAGATVLVVPVCLGLVFWGIAAIVDALNKHPRDD
jgi:hypothetical protein